MFQHFKLKQSQDARKVFYRFFTYIANWNDFVKTLNIPPGLFEAKNSIQKQQSVVFVMIAVNEFKKPEVISYFQFFEILVH